MKLVVQQYDGGVDILIYVDGELVDIETIGSYGELEQLQQRPEKCLECKHNIEDKYHECVRGVMCFSDDDCFEEV